MFQVSSFPLFFYPTLCTLILVTIFWKKHKTKAAAPSKLPPGPPKLPVIGNLHQLIGAAPPHQKITELSKQYGPIMHIKAGQVSTVIISSPELAEQALKTHDLILSQRPEVLAVEVVSYNNSGIAFSPYGNYWRQLRKICVMELFSVRRVQSFKNVREEEVGNLMDSIRLDAGKSINLSHYIYELTNSIISRAAFGKRNKDGDQFKALLKEGIELSGAFVASELFPSFKFINTITGLRPALEKMHKKMDRILEDIVNEHRENPVNLRGDEEDVVDVLLRLQETGDLEFPLRNNNIKAVILDLFAGGSETSSITIEWAMAEMLRNPTVMKKAQDEVRLALRGKTTIDEADIQDLKYLKAVIKETLRLHPPVPIIPRESRESFEMKGYEIPFKTKVIINTWAINRHPDHWVNPNKFDPERFVESSINFQGSNFEYIPFGAGRRMCPGMTFAVSAVELPLANLLYHFNWMLANGLTAEQLDMTENQGMVAKRRDDLFLIASPFTP